MATFDQWIGHRMELVGYVSETHFCRTAGLHRSRLSALRDGAPPREVLSDAHLRHIARLLYVSPKRIRRLAEGLIRWIDDDHCIGPPPGWRVHGAPNFDELPSGDARVESRVEKIGEERRTAAIGRITAAGEVDLEEQWTPDYGPWVPCRIGSGKGTFALRLIPFDPEHGWERWAVFRFVPRSCLPERQDVALFLQTDAEARGLFGRLTVVGDALVLHLQDQRRTALEICRAHIAQLARVVGSWPEAGSIGNAITP